MVSREYFLDDAWLRNKLVEESHIRVVFVLQYLNMFEGKPSTVRVFSVDQVERVVNWSVSLFKKMLRKG